MLLSGTPINFAGTATAGNRSWMRHGWKLCAGIGFSQRPAVMLSPWWEYVFPRCLRPNVTAFSLRDRTIGLSAGGASEAGQADRA